MTDQNQSHPTQGRRRRHKSPASLPAAPHMPLPRLVDHLDTADGPLDEEEEKDAKRRRSEPTTPKSTSRRPREYDEVMGITRVEPRDAGRFQEGNDSVLKKLQQEKLTLVIGPNQRIVGLGKSTGEYGSATLRECLDRISQGRIVALATLHFGERTEKSAGPPHFCRSSGSYGNSSFLHGGAAHFS